MNKYYVRIVDFAGDTEIFTEAQDVTIIHGDIFIIDSDSKEHKFLMDTIDEISIKVSLV